MLTGEEMAAWLRAWWEAAGPWVPDDSLTPDAMLVKRQFEAMLTDFRLADDTREIVTLSECRQ